MGEGCPIDYWSPFQPSQRVSLLYFSPGQGSNSTPNDQLGCRRAVPCAPNPKGKDP